VGGEKGKKSLGQGERKRREGFHWRESCPSRESGEERDKQRYLIPLVPNREKEDSEPNRGIGSREEKKIIPTGGSTLKREVRKISGSEAGIERPRQC